MADRAALSHLRHELRTPLNHIIGYSEMLLEDAGDGGAVAFVPALRRIHDEARHVLGVVNDVLAPSVVDAGAADLARLAGESRPRADRIVATAESLRKEASGLGADEMLRDIDRIATAARQLLAILTEGAVDAPGEPPEEAPPAGPGAQSTILVVDDNDGNRDMLARRLERQGHRVVRAEGGRQALTVLGRQPIDLVLLDVMMPELNGYEVLQRLKQDPGRRDIPVLMISALDEIDSVVRCIELGAEDYLTKPFDPVLLRARVGACLEKKRLRDEQSRHLHELAEWNRRLEQRVDEQVMQVERLNRLKRFFSPSLAEAIVNGGAQDPLATHRREITVVFLDLRGFVAFAETADPEEVMGVLREYHAEMGKLILAHDGTLERFTGDGMMIFFNDPTPVPNPAERAVRMAVAMRERVRGLEAGWRKRGYELSFGVGIAQGYATIGAIGFEGRWDYGAIGTVTNLAARLCSEARPGQILISSRVAAAAEGLVECEEMGSLSLKGLSRPVPTFNVVGVKGTS